MAPGSWEVAGAWPMWKDDSASADSAGSQFSGRTGAGFPETDLYYLAETRNAAGDAGSGDKSGINTLPASNHAVAPAELAASRISETARGFRAAGSGIDKARALQCLSMAVYYEAASESADGQRAVAQVVLNRVAHPSYPASVCGVVFQGSERQTGCQFSFTCDGALARRPSPSAFARARQVAHQALSGAVYAPVGLATHYHTIWISPYWAPSLHTIGSIGAHKFYRWRGAAGMKSAFSVRYRGGEPVAAPHPRDTAPEPASATDPILLAREYERVFAEARRKAQQAATLDGAGAAATPRDVSPHAPTPAAALRRLQPTSRAEVEAMETVPPAQGSPLPESGSVRPEFRNSGRWIAQPN
ncbi:cell wall hydrolase [Alteripontixanthobacter muriae]|uniref:cell wall hydrolase n=1 Tax=Alteripontixanthobacter muriae TaxID=2705546 RepID=UPI001E600112|nr:cell wall hydrolase [Alteripontixanthobacter muriae]